MPTKIKDKDVEAAEEVVTELDAETNLSVKAKPYEATDPFLDEEGNPSSKSFTVTKSVNLHQLAQEIAEAAGVSIGEVMIATTVENPDEDPSESNPVTVFVATEASVTDAQVEQTVLDHEPEVPPVQTNDGYDAAVAKVRAGEVLNTEEITSILRTLVR